ncbi:MAG: hypothetical protein NC090_05770 [Anaeroplasma bactoclasticum]|nr:hypothetical protein [Anaeroplasma bactoclasticum]MCM1514478.1 hypothetical protein [Anaeroplasma bactoclasticum]
MVNKKSIDNLLKKKKYKGDQLGRLLLLTLVDQIDQRPPRIPIDQLSKMIDNLENGYEGSIYNTYVNIYAEVADAYNAIQSSAIQAHLGLTNIKMNLSVMVRAAASQKTKAESPLTITERQYKRYQTKYNKFIKETADKYKKEQQTVQEYLLSQLEGVFMFFDDEPNEKELKELNSKYANITAVLEQYKHENISSKWDAIIRNIYAKHDANNSIIHKFDYEFVLKSIVNSTIHDEEIDNQLDDLKESSVDEVRTNLKALYIDAKYNQDKDEVEASKYALEKVGLKLEILNNMSKEPEVLELPNPITKRDIFDYYIFDMANLYDPDKPEYNRIDAEDAKLLNQFYKDQLADILKAISKDLINENPKLEKLILINNPEDLDKIITGAELAKAGDDFYKELTSITYLKSEHDYGIWNVFPRKDRDRARRYGFSVFHSSDAYTQSSEDYFLKNQQAQNDLLKSELDNFTSSSNQLDQSYSMIERYFKEYQAYCKFIDGLAKFANSKEVKEFADIPEQANVLDEISNIQTLRNLELSELQDILSTTDYRKYFKLIKELYPIPDPNKKRIKQSTNSQVASYIARIFSRSDASNKPVITSVLFDDIAEGNLNE